MFKPLRYRQIHLDFHTSEAIQNVGRDFDATDFVATLKKANVDSITLFARCHHGWCYYPSAVGDVHPGLVREDLLGEMVEACRAADIETPIYITVQWDENLARKHPEWRVANAGNMPPNQWAGDPSAGNQLSAVWHSLCLSHRPYRDYLIAMGKEVIERYETPGLFYDIVTGFECVCPNCVRRMIENGLDPESHEDRLRNDRETAEEFRQEVSAAIWADHPDLRIFYNAGHIDKKGRKRFETYSHLEIESLPTAFWGYDHFPASASYARSLGMDYVGQTGKFHTIWGEFGGFKSAQALIYECGQMVALGSKCLVGDQLHPLGHINQDSYASVAPAYERVKALEPYLVGAEAQCDIAVLPVEYWASMAEDRANYHDNGAVKMLLELKAAFAVIDPGADFSPYRLLILPDAVPVDAAFAEKLSAFVAGGGRILFSGCSGCDPESGELRIDAGIGFSGGQSDLNPCYLQLEKGTEMAGIPSAPVVMYAPAQLIHGEGAEILAQAVPSYFNRSYRAFCSHQHSPEDIDAAPIGPAVTLTDRVGYIAFPVFEMYYRVGQPIYKYLVRELLDRLVSDPVLRTSLPSAGRAFYNVQPQQERGIVHLLFGNPQLRGKHAPDHAVPRSLEMIEDIPVLADISVSVASGRPVTAVRDALTGEAIEFEQTDGRVELTLDRMHIQKVIVLDFASGGGGCVP